MERKAKHISKARAAAFSEKFLLLNDGEDQKPEEIVAHPSEGAAIEPMVAL